MTAQNGLLYVITANQVLHAVDALTGNQRWQQRVEGETRGATPMPAGDTLFVSAGSALNAYRSGTGQMRWQQPRRATSPRLPSWTVRAEPTIVTSERAVYAVESLGNRSRYAWKSCAAGGQQCYRAAAGDGRPRDCRHAGRRRVGVRPGDGRDALELPAASERHGNHSGSLANGRGRAPGCRRRHAVHPFGRRHADRVPTRCQRPISPCCNSR